MDPNYMPFDPNPSKPAFQVPAGAVDAHCHVFGPGDAFPYHSSRKYTPCDAPKARLFALRDFLGFSRNVIVQASCHGPDNRALVDALVNSDGKAKGIAVVDPEVTDKALSELNAAGVKGVRFNFLPRLADELPHETYREIVARIKKLDWQLVVYFEAHDLKRLQPLLQSFDLPIVVDHLGVPDVGKPLDANPDFDAFVDLVGKDDRFVHGLAALQTRRQAGCKRIARADRADDVHVRDRDAPERFAVRHDHALAAHRDDDPLRSLRDDSTHRIAEAIIRGCVHAQRLADFTAIGFDDVRLGRERVA